MISGPKPGDLRPTLLKTFDSFSPDRQQSRRGKRRLRPITERPTVHRRDRPPQTFDHDLGRRASPRSHHVEESIHDAERRHDSIPGLNRECRGSESARMGEDLGSFSGTGPVSLPDRAGRRHDPPRSAAFRSPARSDRQIQDPNRLAHVQDMHPTDRRQFRGKARRLQHQTGRFRDGHEVGIMIGERQRPLVRHLATPDVQHAAARTKDVADRTTAAARSASAPAAPRPPRVAWSPHDRSRSDGLVRRDQDESRSSDDCGSLHRRHRPFHVVPRFPRMVLESGTCFAQRREAPGLEASKTRSVPAHPPRPGATPFEDIRMTPGDRSIDLEQGVLVAIHEDELGRGVGGDAQDNSLPMDPPAPVTNTAGRESEPIRSSSSGRRGHPADPRDRCVSQIARTDPSSRPEFGTNRSNPPPPHGHPKPGDQADEREARSGQIRTIEATAASTASTQRSASPATSARTTTR